MFPLASGKRAFRASESLLRAYRVPSQSRGTARRAIHDSPQSRAVHAADPVRAPAPNLRDGPLLGNILETTYAVRNAASQIQRAGYSVGTGQLNVHEQAYKPDFYEAVAKTMEIRKKYLENRSVWIESKDMIPLMIGLGANPDDIPGMKTVSDRLYRDPTLPFRRSRNSRFCIDYDTNSLRRLEFQPFALSVDEDFKRHDSGQLRRFDEVENDLQLNTVFQALFVFKAMIINGIEVSQRPKLDYSRNKFVCTLFNLRTVTSDGLLGQPALEGVHSDGVDHTMTTYLGSNNMAPNSAATYMHAMDETTGVQLNEAVPEKVLDRVQHRNFLDTLIIVDHENKHSLAPVYQVDKTKEATRDMLIFFTRKPVEKDHISGSIDSLVPHQHLPMEIPLFIPHHI